LKADKRNIFTDIYFNNRWYLIAGSTALLFLLSFFLPWLWWAANVYLLLVVVLTIVDFILLFFSKGRVEAKRKVAPRQHLGASSTIEIAFTNYYSFNTTILWIDELPIQFQKRDFIKSTRINAGESTVESYHLKPVERGEYVYGRIIAYVQSPLQFLQRRFKFPADETIKVYPSTLQMKKYQLLALNDNSLFLGVKRIRRLGHSMEFEQIKEYVSGDDTRTINWKATARRGSLMVNNFTDMKSQQIYCLIDKGRAMKMPFDDLTLLDHAINTSLMMLNVALLKQDKVGLIAFSKNIDTIIAADRSGGQMHKIMEALYRQKTDFLDCDYEALTVAIQQKLSHRSFLMLFTNFETMASLERQLPYLRLLASRHLLCVVFFENTLLKELKTSQPDNLEGIYISTIAERFAFEKKQILKELKRYGILSILTTPQNLTIDVVNKYLELKANQML